MSIFQDLSVIALRHVAKGVGYGVGEAIFDLLVERFTNNSDHLNKALQKANERAWQTLESALAGPSILDVLLKRAEDRAIAEQMREFLDSSHQLRGIAANTDLSAKCLAQLRKARQQGKLKGGQPSHDELAREVGKFALLTDPQAAVKREWEMVEQVAGELRRANYVELARVLRSRPPNNASPVLAVAVRYFFRREVETDQQLFQGLAFANLENLAERQEKGLAALTNILNQQGERYAQVIDEVLGKLGVIEIKIDVIKATVDVINENQVGVTLDARLVTPVWGLGCVSVDGSQKGLLGIRWIFSWRFALTLQGGHS